MARLLDDAMSRGFETVRQLISHDGFTVELGEAIRKTGGVERAIRAMTQEFFPKVETVEPVASVPVTNAKWREVDDVIYFTVTSDGTTGKDWIPRLEAKGYKVEPTYAKKVLLSKDFVSTSGMRTEVAVFKGKLWESDSVRTTASIRAKAEERKWTKPSAEVGCLIREMFTDAELEEMGLWWIVVMHEPIVSGGFSDLLSVNRGGGGRCLDACSGDPDRRWIRGSGFAFSVPQVSLSPQVP